jgi:hypothetical protein
LNEAGSYEWQNNGECNEANMITQVREVQAQAAATQLRLQGLTTLVQHCSTHLKSEVGGPVAKPLPSSALPVFWPSLEDALTLLQPPSGELDKVFATFREVHSLSSIREKSSLNVLCVCVCVCVRVCVCVCVW